MTRPLFAEASLAASLEAYRRVLGPWPFDAPPLIGPRDEHMQRLELGSGLPLASGQTLVGVQMVKGSWVGANHNKNAGFCDHLTLRDCDLWGHEKWASRSYSMRHGNLVEHCSIRDVYLEHGLYWNVAGSSETIPSLTVRRCLFENIGSQALQFVQYGREDEYRTEDIAEGAMLPGGPIQVYSSLFRNVGYNRSGNARAAFALSFFSSGHDVDVAGCFVDNSMQPTSRGGLMCHGGPGRKNLTVRGAIFLMGELEQTMFQVHSVPNVVIRNVTSYAQGGQNWLDIRNCPNVLIEGCVGNTSIHVDGTHVGSIEQGYKCGSFSV